ncbi:MAG: GNAT family N-acetyltransferase [Aliarcobacter sp.]|nr:GNAT family N-acetyltransferase [Aliarcobacter sp.]
MIEKAKIEDLKAVHDLEKELFPNDPFSLSKLSIRYHILRNRLYKIQIDNKIAGYVLWLERKKYFRLYSIAISNDFQNRGLAKKLLEYSFEKLNEENKDFTLEVKVSNTNAIKLYEKYDFEIKKVLKNYYEKEDGYLMIKNRIARV